LIYISLLIAGRAIAARLPDMAETDMAWLGCRKTFVWRIDARCPDTPFGWLVETVVEGADLAFFTMQAFVAMVSEAGAVAIDDAVWLCLVIAVQAALMLWLAYRLASGVVRRWRRS